MATRISQLPPISPEDISHDDVLPITDFESGTTRKVTIQNLQEFLQLEAGYTGSIGGRGFTGSAGPQGPRGYAGSQGDQGFSGLQGLSGAQGPQGPEGYTGSAGLLQPWIVVITDILAQDKQRILANTASTGTFTVTLPASPNVGDYIIISDGADFAANNLIVARNGSTIEDVADDVLLDIKNTTYEFIYSGTTWQVTATVGPRGYTGSRGATGETGPAGFQGLTGLSGPQGYTGSIGAQGPQGAQGYTGSVGSYPSPSVIRPPALTGGSSYDDYSPSGISSATHLIISRTGSGVIVINGISSAGREDGSTLRVYHEDSSVETLRLVPESGSSTAANRILTPDSQNYDITSRSGIELFYDTTAGRWRVLVG